MRQLSTILLHYNESGEHSFATKGASHSMPFTLTGAQVRELRLAVGVTQSDLARSLGYTKYAVRNWERRAEKSIPRTQYQAVLDYLLARRTADDTQRTQVTRLLDAS
jgi:DNA-binding transcriptional regulator YiaG